MGRKDPVWLFEDWTPEERRELAEYARCWRAEHPTLEDLQREACRALMELRDRLVEELSASEVTLPPRDESKLAAEGFALLAQWEAKGGKHSHLYSGRIPHPQKPGSPLISKNQFYALLSGDLSWASTAGRRLRAYLKQNT